MILAVSGSPSPTSKTARVVDHLLDNVVCEDFVSHHLKVRDLPTKALLRGDLSDPLMADAVEAVQRAQGVLIATPIYKASYSGLLKSFLDILPQFGLAGKVVLPCATGGSVAHVLALDYGFRPVLQSMGARHIIQSVFVLEGDVRIDGEAFTVEGPTSAMLNEAAYHFRSALGLEPGHDLLGHPNPSPAAIRACHAPSLPLDVRP
ncbi:MAG: NADPH-dependent FMN reductase [Sphingopyxis sp.]|nr:NADPH-dependent FMN reductase [Sphingopyxis sp.]